MACVIVIVERKKEEEAGKKACQSWVALPEGYPLELINMNHDKRIGEIHCCVMCGEQRD